MARVHNWQIGRGMSYWYPESRPKRQFGAVFDLNKCIACQTCTLACKTTWTSGRGQETMLWNNVESKPYGFYPLGWDVRLLEALGAGEWRAQKPQVGQGGAQWVYEGRTVFEAVGPGERVFGFRPDDQDYAFPNVGEDEIAGQVERGAHFATRLSGAGPRVPHEAWMFYLPRICNHCTYPACLASCPRGSIYKRPEDGIVLVDQSRCRGYQECVRACPYKKVFFNAATGTSEKCIACFPKIEQGLQPQCFETCIGKIRLQGWVSTPEHAREDNPLDWLVHVAKVALPLFPQFGLEPNVYYIPPVHVPEKFLVMMFGPGAEHAVRTYQEARADQGHPLRALLALFGCTPRTTERFRADPREAVAMSEAGEELVRVPVTEPIFVRPGFDAAAGVARLNTP